MSLDREQEAEKQNMGTDAARVKVSIRQGEITLEGKVESLRQKQLAQENALNVAGVDRVNNKLEVECRTNYPEEQIRSFILAELAKDGQHGEQHLEVNVTEGVVVLSGLVCNYVERKNIIEIAQRTPGVAVIDNRIEVVRT